MIEAAVAALRSERCVILPTDTVYGLCAVPTEAAVRELYRVKGRRGEQPTAVIAPSLDALLEVVPELDARASAAARELLPGPYTLVVANPARRLPWLAGARPDTIGVRVPMLPEPARAVLEAAGPVAATSANAPGGRDPRRLEDVPAEVRAGCAAEIDAGQLPGTPSTVVDLSGDEPRILREGAVPAAVALERLPAAVRRA